MLKKTLGILFFILLIAVIAWFVSYQVRQSEITTWKAIPSGSAMIIEITDPDRAVENLQSGNMIWESLQASEAFSNYLGGFQIADSLRQEAISSDENGDKIPIILSFHPNTSQSISTLVLIPHLEKTVFNHLLNAIKNRFNVASDGSQKEIYKVFHEKLFTEIWMGYDQKVAVFSTDRELVERSLKSLKQGTSHFSEDPGFVMLRQTTGSNVDAHIYIHYQNFSEMLKFYANDKHQKAVQWLGNLAGWSALDLIIKNDELLLTGFTNTDSLKGDFLDKGLNQKPVKHEVINLAPFNTNVLLAYSLPEKYVPKASVESIRAKLKIDPMELLTHMNGEISLVGNAYYQSPDNYWFLAHTGHPEALEEKLIEATRKTGGSTISENKFIYRQIAYKKLIPDLFGESFAMMEDCWYFFLENYVVFGNNPQSLRNFGRYFETGKTLDLNENFNAIADNITSSSNLMMLIKPRDLLKTMDIYLNTQTIKQLEPYSATLSEIQGLAVQYAKSQPFAYTSIYLRSSKDYKEEGMAVWKTELDGKVSMKPFLVLDHNTRMYNTLAFDDDANMYLINTDGQIQWKKRIDALPEGQIYQVDYYKNGKIQYLFNTRDFIYLVDKNGDNVANYPKKLNPSATNGLSLFDYNSKKDYRLVVAQADKRIHNYTIAGKQVRGWTKPKTGNIVSDPVVRLVADNKDYIIINDLDNAISIVNRRGNIRIKLKQNPNKAKNSSFYVNRTNSKGIIITTNREGKLTYIDRNGNLEFTDFGNFSPIHFFLYEDYDEDGAKDFIFVDGNQLKVFDRFKNLLFSFTFETTISIKPEFFYLGSKQKVLGVVADQEKAVYLFDKKGNTLISRGLVGETPFTVGSLENNKEINLLTAAENILYNYRLN